MSSGTCKSSGIYKISTTPLSQRRTESEIFDSAPASAEYTPTQTLFKVLDRLLLKLQSELSKLLAVSKQSYPVFALKRLNKRTK